MMFNLNGYQKILFFWAKAIKPVQGTTFYQKEINTQIDLVWELKWGLSLITNFLDDDIIAYFAASLFGLLEFSLLWNRRTDHPGLSIQIRTICFDLRFEYRDLRHWDYEKKCLKSYDEL